MTAARLHTLAGKLAAAGAVLAAGCGGEPPPTAAPDRVPDQAGLALTADGAGRLSAATPFDSAAVRDALPAGFTTERHDGPAGEPVIWALRDGQIVFEVYAAGEAGAGEAAASVGRIDAPSDLVRGPGGAQPGQTFAEAGGAALDCTLGTGDLRDRAVCRGAGVDLVFADRALVGQTVLPPDAALAGAFLERLVWRADG